MEIETKSSYKYLFIINMLSGGTAGFVIDLCLFPLETIKTRKQTCKNFLKLKIYNNFYKGFTPQAINSFPATGIYFSSYELMKHHLAENYKKMSLFQRSLISSIIAEFLHSIFINPFEIVKQQMQTGNQNNMKVAISYIYKTQGFKGFCRGFQSLLVRDVAFSMTLMPCYEVSHLY